MSKGGVLQNTSYIFIYILYEVINHMNIASSKIASQQKFQLPPYTIAVGVVSVVLCLALFPRYITKESYVMDWITKVQE